MQALRDAFRRRAEEPPTGSSMPSTPSGGSRQRHMGEGTQDKHNQQQHGQGKEGQREAQRDRQSSEQRQRHAAREPQRRMTAAERIAHEVDKALLSLNPFTEVQLLFPETTSVQMLLKLDDHRLLSVGENTAQVWNTDHASHVSTLRGHTRPITCATTVFKTVVTASHDHTIKLWDPSCGECRNTIEVPGDVIHALAPVHETTFCCGGQQLYVFSCNGKLVAKVSQEDPDLCFHTLLVLPHSHTILGVVTDSPQILAVPLDGEGVLSPYVGKEHEEHEPLLQPQLLKSDHEHPITSLVQINDVLFASGSQDGSVLLWMSRTLSLCRVLLQRPDVFFDENLKLYTHPVTTILPLPGNRVVIAIKHGFTLVDITTASVLTSVDEAHLGPIKKMALIHHGHFLLTCGGDAVKLWLISQFVHRPLPQKGEELTQVLVKSLSKAENPPPMQPEASTAHLPRPLRRHASTLDPLRPLCVGEMKAHKEPIGDCVTMGSYSFATSSAEQMICLWRNGAYAWRNSNLSAAVALRQSAST